MINRKEKVERINQFRFNFFGVVGDWGEDRVVLINELNKIEVKNRIKIIK